jgi:hypothetical protein
VDKQLYRLPTFADKTVGRKALPILPDDLSTPRFWLNIGKV